MCSQASRSRATLSCDSSYFSYWQGTIQASYAVMRQPLFIDVLIFLIPKRGRHLGFFCRKTILVIMLSLGSIETDRVISETRLQ